MIMTLVFLTFYPFNGFFSFQSLIVAYRCKLELWDDDKVKNIVNPLLSKINVGRRRWQGGKISDDSQYTDAGMMMVKIYSQELTLH